MTRMDALHKIRQNLLAAGRSLKRLEVAANLTEADDAWGFLLYNFGEIANMLNKKPLEPLATETALIDVLTETFRDRTGGDPLITYVFEAKNSKSHAVQPVTVTHPGMLLMGSEDGTFSADNVKIGGMTIGKIRTRGTPYGVVLSGDGAENANFDIGHLHDPNNQFFIRRFSGHIQLVDAVSERGGGVTPVPGSHQGRSISGEIQEVAELALTYYRDKFERILQILDLNSEFRPF